MKDDVLIYLKGIPASFYLSITLANVLLLSLVPDPSPELEHTIPPIALHPAHIRRGRVAQVAVVATIYELNERLADLFRLTPLPRIAGMGIL
jgi:hypothetical protein